jgi:hypothetical protein
VARLGEFSVLDDCFLWAFLKIAKVAHIFGLPFSTLKNMYNSLRLKIGRATFWAFFTNSSGHPGHCPQFCCPPQLRFLRLADSRVARFFYAQQQTKAGDSSPKWA